MKADTKKALKNRIPRRLWRALVGFYRKLLWLKQKIAMLFGERKMPLYCPCCGMKFKRFVESVDYKGYTDFYDVSLFGKQRQDILCPVCGSLPRHRILASWCEANKSLLTSKDVLYFAPERGMTTWLKKNKITFKTADLFDPFTDLKLDIQNTGLSDASYDVVICNHVLEHVGDYMTALKEVKRILRPDGIFICSFPMSPDVETVLEDPDVKTDEERLRRYGQSDHVRLFGMKADQILSEAGYDVTVINGDDYPAEIVPITGPCDYDINHLFLCRIKD